MRDKPGMRLGVVAAAVAVLASAGRGAAQDCASAYMACSAAVVTSSTDALHDDGCYADYLSCLSRMLRFF